MKSKRIPVTDLPVAHISVYSALGELLSDSTNYFLGGTFYYEVVHFRLHEVILSFTGEFIDMSPLA